MKLADELRSLTEGSSVPTLNTTTKGVIRRLLFEAAKKNIADGDKSKWTPIDPMAALGLVFESVDIVELTEFLQSEGLTVEVFDNGATKEIISVSWK